jgi:hypothetical protein
MPGYVAAFPTPLAVIKRTSAESPIDRADHTRRTRAAYDRLASVWSATTDDGPFNGWLERPALQSLVLQISAARCSLPPCVALGRWLSGCLRMWLK